MNRFRAGQGPCRASLHKRGLAQSPSCDCGQRQTMNHTVDPCPLTEQNLKVDWIYCTKRTMTQSCGYRSLQHWRCNTVAVCDVDDFISDRSPRQLIHYVQPALANPASVMRGSWELRCAVGPPFLDSVDATESISCWIRNVSVPKIIINDAINLFFNCNQHFASFEPEQFLSAVRQNCLRIFYLKFWQTRQKSILIF